MSHVPDARSCCRMTSAGALRVEVRVGRDVAHVGRRERIAPGREEQPEAARSGAVAELPEGGRVWRRRAAVARSGGAQHEPAHEPRVPAHERLGDHAAHRPAEHVGPPQPQGPDQGGRVVGHAGDRERRGAERATADARVVERDHAALARERVGEARRPGVHRPREAHDHHERRALAERAIADLAPGGIDRANGHLGDRFGRGRASGGGDQAEHERDEQEHAESGGGHEQEA